MRSTREFVFVVGCVQQSLVRFGLWSAPHDPPGLMLTHRLHRLEGLAGVPPRPSVNRVDHGCPRQSWEAIRSKCSFGGLQIMYIPHGRKGVTASNGSSASSSLWSRCRRHLAECVQHYTCCAWCVSATLGTGSVLWALSKIEWLAADQMCGKWLRPLVCEASSLRRRATCADRVRAECVGVGPVCGQLLRNAEAPIAGIQRVAGMPAWRSEAS